MKSTTKNKPHPAIQEIMDALTVVDASQKMLAGESDMSQTQLSRLFLGGRKNPRIDTIIRLWEALGRLIPVDRLAEFPKALATESAQRRLNPKKATGKKARNAN